MDFGKWALDNKKLIWFIVVILIAGGVMALVQMSKLEDPEIKVKQALVVTVYPGASAHQVELEVSEVLEKSIRSIKSVTNVNSKSMNDVSFITVELSPTIRNEDLEQNWDILRRKVSDTRKLLPTGASEPVVKDDFGDVFGMFYALTSDGYSLREMERYAELIEREVIAIDGISAVTVWGTNKECIYIELYEDRMANLGIHPAEVLSTINGQNQTVYSGYFESADHRMRVTVNDKYRNIEDIGDLILQGHEDDQLRLRDIATIRKGYEEPSRSAMRYDGKPALGISISALSGTDITKLGREVDKRLDEITDSSLPVGLELQKVFFQPDYVNSALKGFMINLIESILIVVFILMLTMGFRSGLILGSNLLIIVLGSLFILNMFDGTLQRVSLASFVLAMGMLVDNAIVIIDGILIDLRKGVPRREALTSIGKKTAMPLLGATLIAVLAFFPIYLSPDTAGVYVRDLFIVLAVSLLLSWLLALTLVPIQAGRMLHTKPGTEGKDPYDNRLYRAMRATITWVLGHKTVTISIAVVLVIASALCFPLLKQGFFPDMTYDQVYIEYKLNEGVNSSRISDDLSEMEKYLLSHEEITHVTSSVGGTPSRYNLVRSIADPSLSYGELIVEFTSPKELTASIDEIQDHLSAQYPDAYVRVKKYNLMYKKYPIEVEFGGPDPSVLRDLTAQAVQIMEEAPGTTLVTSDWESPVPILEVDYTQSSARRAGLSRQDVGMSLLAATNGIPVSNFYDGNYGETIYIRCVNSDGQPIESLEKSPVFGVIPNIGTIDRSTLQSLLTGAIGPEDIIESLLSTTPLSQVTDGIRVIWEDPLVIRNNSRRAMRAQCNVIDGSGVENVRQSIAEQIESISLPEGYTMSWEGEYRASKDSRKYLFATYPLAIVLMITILILLFKDYKKPLIIILCIPLLFIGVILGTFISGKTFGFVSIVATLGLVGMMIKNGIVLMDEVSLQINAGVELQKALLDSSLSRFRPVMMASLTTIVGMIPLLSDDLFGPGAVAIMSGLLVGTLITLLFIPTLYAIFFKNDAKKVK